MKQLLIILLIGILFIGCEKNKYGNVKQQIRFTSEIPLKKTNLRKSSNELRYTQFGDFITSITPNSFVSVVGPARYFSSTGNSDFIALIGGSTGNETLTADFSINSTISVIPTLCCNVYDNPDGQGGGYFKNDVTFKLFFVQMRLNPVIELPVEYSNISLRQFTGQNQQSGRILSTDYSNLNKPVQELNVLGQEMKVYFGKADSSYICFENPLPDYNTGVHLRSSNFTEWTLSPPLGTEIRTIVSTLYFFIEDIIHVYAGTDNIPYTSDDVIVFEPKFWERIGSDANITDN
jgi:hypothetical protein